MQDPETAPPHRGRPAREGVARRDAVEMRRQALIAETRDEVGRIAAEYHARLPRARAAATGLIYARYSTRFQDSIADQVRACFEAAVAREIFVAVDHVFYDLAVRGSKAQRDGLGQAQAQVAAGGVGAFLAFTTNRLHRKMHRCLRFVEEELVERGVRAIFPKSGVDTADIQRWKMLLSFHAMMDEFVVSMYADNVRAAHEGLMERGLVFGTVPFGYAGDPIPGEFTRRKRPRCRLIVDPETGPVVGRIFRWYADDRVTIDEIVRRLNGDPAIPLPPRCMTGAWTRTVVRALLENARYRGSWQYGATQTVWQSKKDYARQVPRDEPLRTAQVEGLRVVPDDLWCRAQRRLAGEPRPVGRKPVDGDRRSRPRMLNGLFRCPAHDRPLYVGGAHGRAMFCKACKEMSPEGRPLYSQLNRALALRLTCQALAGLIRGDDGLVGQVIAACRREAERSGRPDPAKLDALRRRVQQLDRQVAFLLDNLGETEEDRRDSADRLRRLRRDRASSAAELAGREADRDRPIAVPGEAEVHSLLAELGRILEAAATDDPGAETGIAREIIATLTGGRIDLEQQGERRPHRGWLRGRFRVDLLPYLAARSSGSEVGGTSEGVEVVIDYREPAEPDALADRAKALFDEGLLIKEIGSRLGVSRNLVAAALARWHASRGLPAPDGRSRRSGLGRKHLEPPLFERLADEARRLAEEGLLYDQIAARLGCDRNTVTRALAFWSTSRSLPVPDGRSRRKTLPRETSRPPGRRGPLTTAPE